MFKDNTYKTQTERIYKVPLCIQDTIPIYRVSQGAFLSCKTQIKQQRNTEEMLDRIFSFDERMLYVGMTILLKADSMEEQ